MQNRAVVDAISAALDYLGPAYDRIWPLVSKRLSAGDTVAQAVDFATRELDIAGLTEKAMLDAVLSVFGSRGINVDAVGMRDAWRSATFRDDELKLSSRINKLSRMSDIKSVIRNGLREYGNWQKLARDIRDSDLNSGDVSKNTSALVSTARRLMAGDSNALQDYRRLIRRVERDVARLAKNDAPTAYLRRSYQDVIDATQKASSTALNSAMRRLVRDKALYNADRIARTESAKAYGQAELIDALGDSDVVGKRFVLSSRHRIFDICDFHTGADLYGLGNGGYPLSSLPAYPFHPQCTCVQENIYRGQAKKFSPDAAKKYLKKLPESKRRLLLGVAGSESFSKSQNTWKSSLRNYNGHSSAESQVSKNVKNELT